MSNASPHPVSVVALLADIPSTGLLGNNQAQRFTLSGETLAEQSAEFLDFTRYHLSEGRRVVALYPKWRAGRAERAIRFARGSLQSDGIAQVPMNIAPLAISLLADQLAYLAPYLPAGVIGALTEELPNHILAGGWMGGVSNLSTIPITLKQHIGSYLPGTTFLAFAAPVKRVGRVKKGNPAPNIPSRPLEPVQVLVARPEGHDLDVFNKQFTPAVRPMSLSALPEQPLGRAYWGTRKYVEFVAFSAHPEALTNIVRTVRPATCAWCRELVAGLHCPFCGAANQPPVGRPPSRAADVPPPPATSTGEHIRPAWIGQQRTSGPQQAQPQQAQKAPAPQRPEQRLVSGEPLRPTQPPQRRPSGPQQPPAQHPSGPQQTPTQQPGPQQPAFRPQPTPQRPGQQHPSGPQQPPAQHPQQGQPGQRPQSGPQQPPAHHPSGPQQPAPQHPGQQQPPPAQPRPAPQSPEQGEPESGGRPSHNQPRRPSGEPERPPDSHAQPARAPGQPHRSDQHNQS